jgi:3-methyladenine DNA glycosylase AlkD
MLKQKISATAVLEKLKSLADPKAVAGMGRFGIPTHNTLGISVPALRKLARELGKSHELAEKLWQSGVHEAQILAPMVDVPESVTGQQMERWVKEIDSWAVCDGCCLNLFVKTPFAHRKAMEWSRRKEEFVKRAGFALMAALAVHDKQVGDAKFVRFLPVIKRESVDERNFVKKAVNWALRQIGKRNLQLNKAAIRTGHRIQKTDSRSARWIAADALRELNSEAVAMRLRRTIVRRPRS